MGPLVWLVAFIGVQVALLFAVRRALAAVRPRPRSSWKVRILQWGLGLVGVLLVVAVSVPVGHGPNYESRVIGHLRNFSSGQEVFRAESGGLYAPPECLVEVGRCIPGYQGPQIAPTPDPVAVQALHYRLTFHPGPVATSGTGARGLETWAYVAVPATRQSRGRRSFCLDSSGVIAFAEAGQPIELSKAECPASLSPLR